MLPNLLAYILPNNLIDRVTYLQYASWWDRNILDKNIGKDAACTMCSRPGAVQTYTQWGRQECTNGHKLEYKGLIMSSNYKDDKKSEWVCVDFERAAHKWAQPGKNSVGGRLYVTEAEGGSAPTCGDGCSYQTNYEVGCAVCSIIE